MFNKVARSGFRQLMEADGFNTFRSLNLMTNGKFNDATDWSLGAGWSIGSRVAHYDKTAVGSYLAGINGNGPTSNGVNYTLTFTISNLGGAGGAKMRIYTGAGIIAGTVIYSAGTHEVNFVAPGDDANGMQFRAFNDAGSDTFDIDNIILLEN